jgi:hypothetical protein
VPGCLQKYQAIADQAQYEEEEALRSSLQRPLDVRLLLACASVLLGMLRLRFSAAGHAAPAPCLGACAACAPDVPVKVEGGGERVFAGCQ